MNRDRDDEHGRGREEHRDERRAREDERDFGVGRYGREDRFGDMGDWPTGFYGGGPRRDEPRYTQERYGGQDRFRSSREGRFGGFESGGSGVDNRFSSGEDRWGSRGSYDHEFGGRAPRGAGGPQWGNEGYTMGARPGGWGGRSFDEGRHFGAGGGGRWGNESYTGGRDLSMDERMGRRPGREDYGPDVRPGERRMGRPPKGYQRSDERIREDICDALGEHEWVDASEVEVKVQNGEVTLTGTVRDRWSKRTVEDVSERQRGVKDVHNQIRVVQEEPRSSGNGSQNERPGPRDPQRTPRA